MAGFDNSTVETEVESLIVQRRQLLQAAKALADNASSELSQCHELGVRTQAPQMLSGNEDPTRNLPALSAEVASFLAQVYNLSRTIASHEDEARHLENQLQRLWYWLIEFLGLSTRRHRISSLRSDVAALNRRRQEIMGHLSTAAAGLAHNLQAIPPFYIPQLDSVVSQIDSIYNRFDPSIVASWHHSGWHSWVPSEVSMIPWLRVGSLVEDCEESFKVDLQDTLHRELVAAAEPIVLPTFVPFVGDDRAVVIRCDDQTESDALSLFHSLLVRIALMLPHHSLFTLLDPAGHGRAFPMRRFLPRVTENNEEVHSDLREVIARIRHVMQNVLDYSDGFHLLPEATLASEPFEFIFAADFPRGYDRRGMEMLFNVAMTGPKAGRYVFIQHNTKDALPRDFSFDLLENQFVLDVCKGPETRSGFLFVADRAPDGDMQRQLLGRVESARPRDHALRWTDVVDLPFNQWWRENVTTIVRCPVGGEKGELRVWFGVNEDGRPCAHGMLAAMTGQGKSNLYHALILGLAIRYSPLDLRFYLIDGKDGVEFQAYKDLPHAAVVSLKSSAELSRSVLTDLVGEKERRNALFADHGVRDFTAFRESVPGGVRLPRILLLIDEYQELFEDDKEGTASQEILQLAQQGRSVGIHLLLGSQRFGASGMLNQQAIFGNIHLRMALKMSQDDIQSLTAFGPGGKDLIRQCDMPGKIVINDQTGVDNGNSFGKVAKIPDDLDFVRNRIAQLKAMARQKGLTTRLQQAVVFNGADQPRISQNPHLQVAMDKQVRVDARRLEELARRAPSDHGFGIPSWVTDDYPLAMWIGQEFNVRGHALVVLRRGPGQHAAVVGRESTSRFGILAGMLCSLPVLYSKDRVKIEILDLTANNDPSGNVIKDVAGTLLRPLGYDVNVSRDPDDLDSLLQRLIHVLDQRKANHSGGQQESILAMMVEVNKLSSLRRPADRYAQSDSPSRDDLARLLAEGSQYGIHLVLTASAFRLFNQVIDERQDLQHFGHRVALQMSEDDSFSMLGNRRASQLQAAGPRPIVGLCLNLEAGDNGNTFKPYDSTDLAPELEQLARRLHLPNHK